MLFNINESFKKKLYIYIVKQKNCHIKTGRIDQIIIQINQFFNHIYK